MASLTLLEATNTVLGAFDENLRDVALAELRGGVALEEGPSSPAYLQAYLLEQTKIHTQNLEITHQQTATKSSSNKFASATQKKKKSVTLLKRACSRQIAAGILASRRASPRERERERETVRLSLFFLKTPCVFSIF